MKSGTLPNVLRCQTTRALVHHNALLDSDDDACPKKGTGGRGGGGGGGGIRGGGVVLLLYSQSVCGFCTCGGSVTFSVRVRACARVCV